MQSEDKDVGMTEGDEDQLEDKHLDMTEGDKDQLEDEDVVTTEGDKDDDIKAPPWQLWAVIISFEDKCNSSINGTVMSRLYTVYFLLTSSTIFG